MTSDFADLLRETIASAPDRCLPWAQVMDLALYHPEHGYYAGKPRRVGRSGDFYTAVSVGPLYGQLLAAVAAEVWQSLGAPGDFTLIEQGAHDGQLAEDLWRGWPHETKPRYLIVEPQAGYREVQRARLQPLMGERVAWVESLLELGVGRALCSPTAFFLSNELPDAFPVHRVRWSGGQWRELAVTPDHVWVEVDIADPDVGAEIQRLPTDLPEGYTTEVHPASVQWMESLARAPFRGAVLIADYGYEAPEYYAPERSDGTLRRYQTHRTDGEVLKDLGRCDLTAHINFTRLIEVAEDAGLTVRQFQDQGRFLTHAATPWLRSLEGRVPDAATLGLLRQFQSLTHPGHMGAAFRLLCLDKR
jgi:SAM-dependent MidA family methyltransferase